jgi:hypothetical protein
MPPLDWGKAGSRPVPSPSWPGQQLRRASLRLFCPLELSSMVQPKPHRHSRWHHQRTCDHTRFKLWSRTADMGARGPRSSPPSGHASVMCSGTIYDDVGRARLQSRVRAAAAFTAGQYGLAGADGSTSPYHQATPSRRIAVSAAGLLLSRASLNFDGALVDGSGSLLATQRHSNLLPVSGRAARHAEDCRVASGDDSVGRTRRPVWQGPPVVRAAATEGWRPVC